MTGTITIIRKYLAEITVNIICTGGSPDSMVASCHSPMTKMNIKISWIDSMFFIKFHLFLPVVLSGSMQIKSNYFFYSIRFKVFSSDS